MLVALGFKPIKAAVVALVANTAPGRVRRDGASPVITLAQVTGLPLDTVASMVGPADPVARAVRAAGAGVPGGRHGAGVREAWVPALVCGVVFALAQFVTSNYISVPLTDIVASLLGARWPWSCWPGVRPTRAGPAARARDRGRGGPGTAAAARTPRRGPPGLRART